MTPSADELAEEISRHLEEKDQAREEALALTRVVVRRSGAAIRSVHRGELDRALDLADRAGEDLAAILNLLKEHPDVRYSGLVDGAEQEYAEARIVYALITEERIPIPRRWGSR